MAIVNELIDKLAGAKWHLGPAHCSGDCGHLGRSIGLPSDVHWTAERAIASVPVKG